ncbi:MAG: hypothetical protein JWO62_1918 [Acidimicrobiaceae bacterium]|nr:hypothetical protein [Acidimicrobiaceae bacterium]
MAIAPGAGRRVTALVAVAGVAEAVNFARRALGALVRLESVDLVEAEGVELVAEAAGTHPPLAGRAMLVLECASEEARDSGAEEELRSFLAAAPEIRGLLVAADGRDRDELASWRDEVPRALAAAGGVGGLAVTVEPGEVPSLLALARTELALVSPSAILVAHGSLVTGCMHLGVIATVPGAGRFATVLDPSRVDAALTAAAVQVGGERATCRHRLDRATEKRW